MTDNPPAPNTDRELFREDTGEPAGSYYENHVFVTAEGHIGMNVGGTVFVKPIAGWHGLAVAADPSLPWPRPEPLKVHDHTSTDPWSSGPNGDTAYIDGCAIEADCSTTSLGEQG